MSLAAGLGLQVEGLFGDASDLGRNSNSRDCRNVQAIARHVAMKGLRGFSSRLMRGDSVPNSDPSEWVCQLELRFACHSFHCCRCFTGSTESIFRVL
ncbi:MAG: hypothetical protein RLZZ11_776 [Cyanobacteriota bacterium]|jgi:hypothetical protein